MDGGPAPLPRGPHQDPLRQHEALAEEVRRPLAAGHRKKRARGLESGARRAFYGTIVSALAATANSAICRSPTHATALMIASAAPDGRASDARSPKANANARLSFVFTYRSAASAMPTATCDGIVNLKQCVGCINPGTAARAHAPLRYKKKARCSEVHRAPWYRAGWVLLLVEFLPGILGRGAERLDLDVGELAPDPAHFAQVLGLDDVARGGIDRDRPARAVRVLEILQ